jgi:O-methyltransferase
MKSLLRAVYKSLPESVQKPLIPLGTAFLHATDKDHRQRQRWYDRYYGPSNIFWREQLFISLARFMNVNRPYSGYYMEFGCHSGMTMKLAWKHFRWLTDLDYIAFDSFEGLPEIADVDRMAIWERGRLKTEEQDFVDIVTGAGMPANRLRTVKGFYDKSLTPVLAASLQPKKAAVVYVDCDLYESAVPVLKFCRDFLQPGTLVVFDDWNCFYGDPERGERRAFREFCEANPTLRFSEVMSTPEAKVFCHLG